MDKLTHFFHFLLTIDVQIGRVIHENGDWAYAILFGILFAETGFVITPFLPGDTLLFAAGIFSHPEKHALNLWIVLIIFTFAPLCGDAVNFHIGKWLGPTLFKNPKSKIFNRSALDKTHRFFERYGPKTIILARWVPIVRTFAPFVAGMSQMPFREFIGYSAIGGFAWVWICTLAGYAFGSLPIVKDHFSFAMLGMALVAFVPVAYEMVKHKRERRREALELAAAEAAQ